MKRKQLVFTASLMVTTMMLAGSVAMTDVHADNLISSAQARDGTLVTEEKPFSQKIDLSDQMLTGGLFLDFNFDAMDIHQVKGGAIDQVKIQLKGGSRYYCHGSNFHHLIIRDSSGNTVYETTTSFVNENRIGLFSISKDDVYTITYDQFDQTETSFYGSGENVASLAVYKTIDNNSSEKIDFSKKPLDPYINNVPSYFNGKYAIVAFTGPVDKFKWSNTGFLNDGSKSDTLSYLLHDQMTYYPVFETDICF